MRPSILPCCYSTQAHMESMKSILASLETMRRSISVELMNPSGRRQFCCAAARATVVKLCILPKPLNALRCCLTGEEHRSDGLFKRYTNQITKMEKELQKAKNVRDVPSGLGKTSTGNQKSSACNIL